MLWAILVCDRIQTKKKALMAEKKGAKVFMLLYNVSFAKIGRYAIVTA